MADAVIATLAGMGVALSALRSDSRQVQPGDVFLAYPGSASDGRSYIGQAVARGAGAVLWEAAGFAWNPQWAVPNLPVTGLKACAGEIADRVYGRPSERVPLVGVTGTNGKTSVSHWIAQALEAAGQRCALIGTLGCGFPGALEDGANTTPDAILTQLWLRRFVDAGAAAVAMEVSSIGVDQGRIGGIRFQTAVFTNLSRDHLEYHGTMEAYAEAKARFFDVPGLHCAVVNADDAFGMRLLQRLDGRGVHRIAYTLGAARVPHAEQTLRAADVDMDGAGVRLRMVTEGATAATAAPVVGLFNVSNLLATAGALLGLGHDLAQAAAMLGAVRPPPGRMQPLGGDGQPLVVVDYAHTPDALAQVLTALRPVAAARGGRLHTVFGCGGDRDRGKRPLMGEIVARLSDSALVTSDNPRNEEPAAIVEDILAGMPLGTAVELDRARAIARCVAAAAVKDVVLVAGKGHEPYQEVRGQRRPFSDEAEVRAALALSRRDQGVVA